jgi:methyltransferase (TIGR00027 family)
VILGAGMDTFAYRNPELLSKIHIFEADHPDTQKFKKMKVEQAGWVIPGNLHYVPVDFTKDDLSSELFNSGFDAAKITFYSWLGVTYYLKKMDIENMVKTISSLSPDGSALLFDYPDENFLASDARRVQNQIAMAQAAGEPMKPGYCYEELEKLLADYGFLIYEHLTTSDIESRFFANRSDYCRPSK